MTRFIDALLEPALWFAADWSLRWAMLIGVAALSLLLLRPRRAAMRQLLCLVALVGGLLLPFTPRWGDWRLAKETAAPPQVKRTADDFAIELPSRRRPPPEKRQTQGADVSRSEVDETKIAEEPPSESLGSRRLAVLGLVLCWNLAVVFHLIRWLGGWWFLRRLRRSALTLQGSAADVFAACRLELGVSDGVWLAAHPHVHSPILLGVFRPLILVPSNWFQMPLDVQRAGLLHELAHVRRRDHWLAPLLETIRVAFFFHPPLRWLLVRLERERELLCDEMVVGRGIDRHDYARMLLDFARQSSRLTQPRLLSGSYLPIGRRRTVKVRIHHLLEDDMERWIRPLPARWAVMLGASLLALMLGLASYRVRAVENEKPNAPAEKEKPALARNAEKKRAKVDKSSTTLLKREELRYGGKDFNQWRRDLLTELKGSIRVDGMKAFAAFGANGYGPEATQAILDIMHGYDTTNDNPKDDDGAVVKAGYQAIDKIRADAVPVLTAAAKNANRNVRRFAIQALGNLGSDARSAIPTLLQAMKHEDYETRRRAMRAVAAIDAHTKGYVSVLSEALKDNGTRDEAISIIGGIGKKAHAAIPALMEALAERPIPVIWTLQKVGAGKEAVIPVSRLLRDNDQTTRREAYQFLQSLGTDAKEAVPALLEALGDKSVQVRSEAMDALVNAGAGKEAVVPVSRLLRDDYTGTRQTAYQFLQSLGADAKEAVPALIAIVKEPKGSFTPWAVHTLRSIGPGAKEAIPALTELLRSEDKNLREKALNALKVISP